MSDLKIRLVRNKSELDEVFKIREIVFIKGQNVPWHEEMDGLDKEATQIIVLLGRKAIGCARILFINNKAKLERLALFEEYRGKGLGRKLLDYMVKYSTKKNVSEIYLNAQCWVKDFYAKAGFKSRGKTFMEAGIEHIQMFLEPKHI